MDHFILENNTVKPMSDNPSRDYRYYWRNGMDLRPACPRLTETPAWSTLRHNLFDAFHEVPDDWNHPSFDTDFIRLLNDHMWQEDELMQGVVDAFSRDRRKARADFKLALSKGIDKVTNPDPELVALFEQLDTYPEWFDLEAAERGRVAYYNVSETAENMAIAFSFYATSMEDRTSASTAVTRMFDVQPLKRSLETTKMLASIGLKDVFNRYSSGLQATVNVRLIHAQATRGLGKSWGEQHFNTYGPPISSTFVAGGEGWFAMMPLLADEKLGRKHTEQEWDDLAMYWAYILYIIGVEEEIIPKTGEQMRLMADYLFANAGEDVMYREQMVNVLLGNISESDPEGPFKSLGALSILIGRDAITDAVRGTKWEDPRIDEYAQAAKKQGEKQAAELVALDQTAEAETIYRQRASADTPPWMTRHRGVLERASRLEPDLLADYASHDAVHDSGPELRPL